MTMYAQYSVSQVITPSDTAGNKFAAIMAGVAGAIAYQSVLGTTITLAAVPAYTVLPVGCVRVMATGTAATNIIGFN